MSYKKDHLPKAVYSKQKLTSEIGLYTQNFW